MVLDEHTPRPLPGVVLPPSGHDGPIRCLLCGNGSHSHLPRRCVLARWS